MADLTLERIARIRADIYQNASDESYWDARDELLDAAERGLTNDRKAAAFDVLEKLSRGRGVVEVYVRYNGANYDVVIMRAHGSDIDSCGDELDEAILPLAKHIKEPTDAQ